MSNAAVPDADAVGAAELLRAVRLFLLLLVCGDLVYMAIHVGHFSVPALKDASFSLEADGGFAEFFQYTKEMWLAMCLAAAFFRRRQLVLLVWCGFFAFLLMDDALQLHERAGLWLARRLSLPAVAGMRPDDLGELLVAGAVGGSLLTVLGLAWWRDRQSTWQLSRDLLILTAALGLCGVLLDSLHVIAYFKAPAISNPLAFVEDGGELLIVSALTACALDLAIRGTAAPAGLRRLMLGGPQPTPTALP